MTTPRISTVVLSGLMGCLAAACVTTAPRPPVVKPNKGAQPVEAAAPTSGVAVATSGMADYSHHGQPAKAEWIVCRLNPSDSGLSKDAVLVFNRDRAGYDAKSFCSGWIAQAFLSAQFHVVAVNRPGFGASSGYDDLGGEWSMAALDAGLDAASANALTPAGIKVAGLWGWSEGAMAASLYAKHKPGFAWVLLGGAILDVPDTLSKTKDPAIRSDLERLSRQEQAAGLEARSIARDADKLPRRVTLYHGRQDEAVPFDQSQQLYSALLATKRPANMVALEKQGHEIPWTLHQQVIRDLVAGMREEAK